MSDVDHAAEIRHKAEVITLTTDSIAERYGLSEYIVGKFREEAREIKVHADALQRERDKAREALAAERARVVRSIRLARATQAFIPLPDFWAAGKGRKIDEYREALVACRYHGDLCVDDESEAQDG